MQTIQQRMSSPSRAPCTQMYFDVLLGLIWSISMWKKRAYLSHTCTRSVHDLLPRKIWWHGMPSGSKSNPVSFRIAHSTAIGTHLRAPDAHGDTHRSKARYPAESRGDPGTWSNVPLPDTGCQSTHLPLSLVCLRRHPMRECASDLRHESAEESSRGHR